MRNDTYETLSPIAVCSAKSDFDSLDMSNLTSAASQAEYDFLEKYPNAEFDFEGFCVPCRRRTKLLVDMKWGGVVKGDVNIPNWRERLACKKCSMNNRQRLMVSLIDELVEGNKLNNIYFMEHVTPIFAWANKKFYGKNLIGSEYLGPEYSSGDVIKGIRHENVEDLSFDRESLDLIVSNDVFEHVPNTSNAFKECYRVLAPGGQMLATFPFYILEEETSMRAEFKSGELVYIKEAEYHGNPVDDKGSLVFTDFGWDVLQTNIEIGFSSVKVELFSDVEKGHLGDAQVVFRFIK